MFGYVCLHVSHESWISGVVFKVSLTKQFIYICWWPRCARVKATEGVRKPPEAAHPTQQNMASTVWRWCPPSACVFYCSVCVCWSARPSWQGKGNTRAVFVQGTGLALVAHTYTYKHARTHLAKTEAYCGLQAQFGPPTTVTHCVTFCILSLPFISFYLIVYHGLVCFLFLFFLESFSELMNLTFPFIFYCTCFPF